jgi:uncharacterized integral membrane protein
LMRLFGIAVVTQDGSRAGRLRTFCRSTAVWAPVWGTALLLLLLSNFIATRTFGLILFALIIPFGVALLLLFVTGAIWAGLRPERGLQDRIAGTWLVPR